MNQHQKNKLVKAAFNYLSQLKEEHQIILYLNEDDTVKIVDITENNSVEHVDFSMNKLTKIIDLLQEKEVYTAHNHPSGSKEPSMSDYVATSYFNSLLRINNVCFMQEFIVTDKEVVSYAAPKDNTFSYFEEQITFPIVVDEPVFHSFPILNYDKKTVEDAIYPHLKNNYEIICVGNSVNISKHFSFHELMELTNNAQEVPIIGIPYYRMQQRWERIQDLETVFGSIEFYSTKEGIQSVIALKQDLIL